MPSWTEFKQFLAENDLAFEAGVVVGIILMMVITAIF